MIYILAGIYLVGVACVMWFGVSFDHPDRRYIGLTLAWPVVGAIYLLSVAVETPRYLLEYYNERFPKDDG